MGIGDHEPLRGYGTLDSASYAAAGPDGASCSSGVAVSVPWQGPYVSGPRSVKDVWWFRALLILGASCVLGGIITAARADQRVFGDFQFLDVPSTCSREGFMPRMLQEVDPEAEQMGAGIIVGWLVLSLLLPLGLGILWLRAWAKKAESMIWVSVGIHVGSLLVGAILMFAMGAAPGGAVMLFMAIVVAVLWGCCREQMALCARLLSVAAHGLQASPGLVWLSLGIWGIMGAVLLAATGFGIAAFANGSAVPSPDLVASRRLVFPADNATITDLVPTGESYAAVYSDHCEMDGMDVPCCTWRTSPGAIFYIWLLSVCALWSWMSLGAARQFIVSGAVAQWYYAPAGSGAPQGALKATMKNAAGPQAGTVVFGGAVLAMVQALRQAANSNLRSSDQQQGVGGAVVAMLCCTLRCIAVMVLAVVEFLCRFSLIWASMTGLGLIDAGKEVTALLKRNLLDVVTVWWMPGAVVGLTAMALAMLWGSIVFAAVAVTVQGQGSVLAAVGVAALGALAMGVVLQLLGSLLLDAVDTVFVCWACDKDQQLSSRPDVDEVFGSVVKKSSPPGAVITQPAGGYAYGANDSHQPGIQMQAPRPAAM